MAVWPLGLPQYLRVEGFEEQPPNTVIRTQVETGPVKRRRRFTAAPRPIKGTIRVSFAQRAILDDFFNDTLKGGALSFDWVHPITRAAATFAFARPPVYSPVNRMLLSVRLDLEILP